MRIKKNPYFCEVIERKGTEVPFLHGMKTEEQISIWAQEKIDEIPGLFLVDVKLLPKNRVVILVDGDQGVGIADCAKISRYIGFKIEEVDLIKNAFVLDVSSPGIDHPLKLKRQYAKNVGRNLQVLLTNGERKSGVLTSLTEDHIILEEEKNKKKKGETETYTLPFSDIKEAKVEIVFK